MERVIINFKNVCEENKDKVISLSGDIIHEYIAIQGDKKRVTITWMENRYGTGSLHAVVYSEGAKDSLVYEYDKGVG